MCRRFPFACLCLLLVAFTPALTGAAESETGSEAESLWVTSIARLGGSDQFLAATADGLLLREASVYSFPADNPDARTLLYTHPAAVWCVASTSNGERVASVDYRGNLMLFDVAASEPKLHENALERWCQAMLVSPDDKAVVAGNEAGKVLVWDIESSSVAHSVELDGHAVTGLAFSADGSQLAASDGGGHVHLLKWPGLEEVGKIAISEEPTWCVAFVDQGSHLLVGSSDRNLYRCEAKADAKAEVVAKGTDWITQLAVSPAGQVAAAEVGGRLHFPGTGGTDSMEAESGVWSLCWNGESQLFAGTRNDGIVIAGRSWKWTEPQPAPAEPEAAEPAPTESEAAKEEAKEQPAEQPASETPAENAEEKPAEEKPAEAAAAEEKPAEPQAADDAKPENE